ncbi:MAG: dihydroorotate dehydrogenase [Candidatus Eremiobacteraeota bacterium]|nr:dihydroorotate dehydrogenase [Candidatus Eremiobacteraeota bacterium]
MNNKAALDLRLRIGTAVLKNPVIAASGCYNRGAEYARIVDVSQYGAITLKSVTREPRLGNDMPRIMSTPGGMLNAIGLQGPGIEHFIAHEAPKLSTVPTAIIASVAGFSVDEFVCVAGRMDGLPNVVALELDVSCPNVDREGRCFAAEPETIAAVISAVKARVSLPVIAKLMPNVADLKPIAKAAQEAGADALSLINAVRGMAIDVKAARPLLANVSGGLSGPAIRPIAVHAVWETASAVTIPLIGMGGIETGADALEFLFAGASGVAIGTANFRNPLVHIEVLAAIRQAMLERGFDTVSSLMGLARPEAHPVRAKE